MFKRVTIVALLVAAFVLLVAVPAMAFNGFRADYTLTSACASCHTTGSFGAPKVYDDYTTTKHFINEEGPSALEELPRGSVCGGCHSGNYSPAKVVPELVDGAWVASNGLPKGNQSGSGAGESASSETFIGCSSCHYGASAGISASDGPDANDSAHQVPLGNMADAQICGACHSRYSYTKNPIEVVAVTAPPSPGPETAPVLIQPQMAIGYPMLGSPSPAPAWSPNLADYLIVQQPGWTPSPTATSAAGLMTYWQTPAAIPSGSPTPSPAPYADTMWQNKGHDGSAAQYPEWKSEGHAAALTALTSQPFWASFPEATKQQCLECHSADFRILKEKGENPTSADVKYGVTCVGCHAPHNGGTIKGVWDEEFDAQLNDDADLAGNASNLCVECHNGEIPEGGEASPGSEVHHPMKEMMDGYGAIDVTFDAAPSVHKGKCVQCHMPPTSISRGNVQLGGNHTFTIIKPEVANETMPIPAATVTARATAAGVVTTTRTVTKDSMPYSACSTCHANNNSVKATPIVESTVIATPSPNAVSVTITQDANGSAWGNFNGGDRAMWLQDTIDQRQEWTKAKIAAIWDELDKAAVALGYADTDAAHTALTAMAPAARTTAQNAFLIAFTNNEFVDSEGSYGLHNWRYSAAIVNKAMEQAKIAASGVVVKLPWVVKLSLSKSSVKAGAKVKFSGSVMTAKGVAGTGTVKITKRVGGVWKAWKNATVKSGKYSLTVKMTKKGTFYFRALMPADSLNKQATSGKRKLVVK